MPPLFKWAEDAKNCSAKQEKVQKIRVFGSLFREFAKNAYIRVAQAEFPLPTHRTNAPWLTPHLP